MWHACHGVPSEILCHAGAVLCYFSDERRRGFIGHGLDFPRAWRSDAVCVIIPLYRGIGVGIGIGIGTEICFACRSRRFVGEAGYSVPV